MAITNANWNSATDPFRLALAYAASGAEEPGGSGWTRWWVRIHDVHGALNGYISDPDIQEIYITQEDTVGGVFTSQPVEAAGLVDDGTTGLTVDCLPVDIAQGAQFTGSFSHWREDAAGDVLVPVDLVGAKGLDLFIEIRSAGVAQYSGKWSLYIFSAFAWDYIDPAQWTYSFLKYYIPRFSHIDLTDMEWLFGKATFQDLSTHYDSRPLKLDVIRRVGERIGEQLRKGLQGTDCVIVQNAVSRLCVYQRKNFPILTEADVPWAIRADVIDAIVEQTAAWVPHSITIEYGNYVATRAGNFSARGTPYKTGTPVHTAERNRTGVLGRILTGWPGDNVEIKAPEIMRWNDMMRTIDLGELRKTRVRAKIKEGLGGFAYDVGERIAVDVDASAAPLLAGESKLVSFREYLSARLARVGQIEASGPDPVTVHLACIEKTYDLDNLKTESILIAELPPVGKQAKDIGPTMMDWFRAPTNAQWAHDTTAEVLRNEGSIGGASHAVAYPNGTIDPLNTYLFSGYVHMHGGRFKEQLANLWPAFDMYWQDIRGTANPAGDLGEIEENQYSHGWLLSHRSALGATAEETSDNWFFYCALKAKSNPARNVDRQCILSISDGTGAAISHKLKELLVRDPITGRPGFSYYSGGYVDVTPYALTIREDEYTIIGWEFDEPNTRFRMFLNGWYYPWQTVSMLAGQTIWAGDFGNALMGPWHGWGSSKFLGGQSFQGEWFEFGSFPQALTGAQIVDLFEHLADMLGFDVHDPARNYGASSGSILTLP